MKSCWNCNASVPDTYRYCLSCGSDVDAGPAPGDPLVGRTLDDKYKILDQLGSGAMGTIYKAEQLTLGKEVVIKLLHKQLLGDPELVSRFEREARAASLLNSPNCVQIIDFGQTKSGALFIAMEYIPGDDLATILERDYPLDHRRIVNLMKQVCLALDEAHANGVLHRDLKPENIMVTRRRNVDEFVKVVDFGIAKLEDNNPRSKRSFKTRTGIVCGTPEYMSPEQARGKTLDARSDIYALGIALYHLVTDRLPFDAPSPIEIVTKHLSEPPVPPSEYREDIPESLERLILTMMEKDREKRPPSAMDVHAELERIDRELAIASQEKVQPPARYGDQTVVDMKPSAILQAAILAADADEPLSAYEAMDVAKTVEDLGTPAAAIRKAAPQRGRVKNGAVNVHAPPHVDPRADTLPAKNATRRKPGTPLSTSERDAQTIDSPAARSPSPTTTSERAAPKRSVHTTRIVLISVALAIGLGLATWAIIDALQ